MSYNPERPMCEVCSLIWCALIIVGCAYLVFWRGHNGWWFALAILLMSGWNCKPHGSAEGRNA
jgi:hypothetical protein